MFVMNSIEQSLEALNIADLEFEEHHKVLNGFSDLLMEVLRSMFTYGSCGRSWRRTAPSPS